MKNVSNIGWLIAIGLLIYIYLCQEHCAPSPQQYDTTYTVTHTYDTNIYSHQIPAPKPKASVEYVPYPVMIGEVDTAEVIRAYFTAHYYEEMIEDTNLIVMIQDSVFNNNITWRNFSYRLLRPTAIHNTTISKQPEVRNMYYLGVGTSVGVPGGSPALGPELLFLTKNKTAYRAAYLFPGTISASVYFKIGK
jgi:hypothetical protein